MKEFESQQKQHAICSSMHGFSAFILQWHIFSAICSDYSILLHNYAEQIMYRHYGQCNWKNGHFVLRRGLQLCDTQIERFTSLNICQENCPIFCLKVRTTPNIGPRENLKPLLPQPNKNTWKNLNFVQIKCKGPVKV